METSNLPTSRTEVADSDHLVERTLVEWRVHLLAARPSAFAGVTAVCLLAGVFGAMAIHHWIGAVLGPLLVLSSVAEFVFPITYRLTTHGAYCSYGIARLWMPWRHVRRIVAEPDGFSLSPFARPCRMDAFRGIRFRFQAGGHMPDAAATMELARQCVESARSGV